MRSKMVFFIKSISFVSILFWSITSVAQSDSFENRIIYFSIDVGNEIISKHDNPVLVNFGLDSNSSPIYSYRQNLIIFPKGNIGYCIGLQQATYPYTLTNPTGVNSNYKLIDPITRSLEKKVFYVGLNYRLQKRRFVIIPYLQIGYCSSPTYSTSISFKEMNSSSIRTVSPTFKNDLSPFHYSLGTDFRIHIFPQMGAFLSFYWDRYSSNTEVNSIIDEHNSLSSNHDNVKMSRNSLMFSFGIFASFLSRKADAEKAELNRLK